MPLIKLCIRKIWLWSWLLTLPICTVGNYWLANTIKEYSDFKIRYNISPEKTSLLQIGKFELAHLTRNLKLLLVADYLREKREHRSRLKTIDLIIPQPELAKLNASLPQSGFDYVKGRLWNDGGLRKVKIRYRGDYNYHWMFHKKSMRVKTQRARLYAGVRKFNLLANKFPYQLANYPGYLLKDHLGNLGPHAEMVNVRINGRHKGTHTYVEQIDESMLRRAGYLPGDIYSGELSAKDRFVGSSADLFRQGGMWDKVAFNNHYEQQASHAIEALVLLVEQAELESSTDDTHLKLQRMLNVEEWGRFMAFESISQTHHYDRAHNWRLYFDPGRSNFVPIIWDPVAWAWSRGKDAVIEADIAKTRIQKALLQSAPLLASRVRHLVNFYDQGNDIKLLSELDETIEEIAIASQFDPDLRPASVKETVRQMNSFRSDIARALEGVKSHYDTDACIQSFSRATANSIRLRVSGRCEVKDLAMRFNGKLPGATSMSLQFTRTNGEVVNFEITDRLTIEGDQLGIDLSLMAEHRTVSSARRRSPQQVLEVLPATYDFIIQDNLTQNELINFSVDVHGRRKQVLRVDKLEVGRLSIKTIIDPDFSRKPLVWSGEKTITGLVEVNQPLVILPGSTIHLEEGASLLIRGRLTAHGTKDMPIKFIPGIDSQGPWGTVAILTERGSGSELKHTEFVGGSGLKRRLYEYSGMFSVHSATEVLIEDSIFRDNHIVDDMVHFVYADVTINNSQFLRSHLDAIDADVSTLTISNSLFQNSGNDALDLMTTNCTVTNSEIVGSLDKAISVGEASTLIVTQSRIIENKIGIQSKDGSTARISGVSFTGNDLAIDAYKKNWRYAAGGKVYVSDSKFIGNGTDLAADKKSKISLSKDTMTRPITIREVADGG